MFEYKIIFDEFNPNYDTCRKYNKMYLNSQFCYLNDLLNTRGYVFLRDVLEAIHAPMCRKAITAGWTRDDKIIIHDIVKLSGHKHGLIVSVFVPSTDITNFFKG